MARHKLPPLKSLRALCAAVQREIDDDYRASEFDDEPGICLTVGWQEDGEWSYQTGDNSYTGAAYHYPHWAVVSIYRDSHCGKLAREIQGQLADLVSWR